MPHAFSEVQTSFSRSLDGLHEWHRDGLNTRIDSRAIHVITRLHRIADSLLTDHGLEDVTKRTLKDLLEKTLVLAIRREKLLEHRAARERESVPKFENNAQADIARVFIDDLSGLRKDYLELVVQQMAIRQAAGMETESLLQLAQLRISVEMEYLAGQVTLDATSLRELRAQLSRGNLWTRT